jgi:hypothetical protein
MGDLKMGWERRNGRSYYYRVKKRAGRVVKSYVGRGRMGEIAEALEVEARRRRADREEALRAEKSRTGHADRAMDDLDRACALAIRASLIGAGYHRVNFQWRRKRVRDTDPAGAEADRRG